MAKTASKKLEDQCEVIIRAIVKHNGKCLRCRRKPPVVELQWAHIISRGAKRIKFDLDNCFCLCKGCHMYFTKRPQAFALFVKELLGDDKYWELHRRSMRTLKDVKLDYGLILEHLKKEYDKITKMPDYSHAFYYHGLTWEKIISVKL